MVPFTTKSGWIHTYTRQCQGSAAKATIQHMQLTAWNLHNQCTPTWVQKDHSRTGNAPFVKMQSTSELANFGKQLSVCFEKSGKQCALWETRAALVILMWASQAMGGAENGGCGELCPPGCLLNWGQSPVSLSANRWSHRLVQHSTRDGISILTQVLIIDF